MSRYDLIIVGGGLVGAGLAVALQSAPLKIALIDARLPSSDDPRLFGLNSTSCQFLENLGVWPALALHASPIHQVHVSHQGQFGAVRLNRDDVQLPQLGNVLPAFHIESALNDALTKLENVTIFRPARLTALKQTESCAELEITTEEGTRSISASLVIGADGTESTVRQLLGIQTDIHDYAQSALVTRSQLTRSHHQIAYERFTSEGAIAMLPLKGNECATIWTADTPYIENLKQLSDVEFTVKLQESFGYRLGKIAGIHKRHVFPLRLVRATKAVEGHVYLLGNALHTVHPIAAQGFNLAIYEVAALVDEILSHAQQQKMITPADLLAISDANQKQQAMSIGVSHRLTQIFASDSILPNAVISLGMVGFNTLKPVKKKFIESLLGKNGQVPPLLMS